MAYIHNTKLCSILYVLGSCLINHLNFSFVFCATKEVVHCDLIQVLSSTLKECDIHETRGTHLRPLL
jgi:hypothetical protein